MGKLIDTAGLKIIYYDIRDRIATLYQKPVTGIPASDLSEDIRDAIASKADKTDTVLLTSLSRGRKANTTAGTGSIAFGSNTEASGTNSEAYGSETKASDAGACARGFHSEAVAKYSSADGKYTIAGSNYQHAFGMYNIPEIQSEYPEWTADTQYYSGDIVRKTSGSTVRYYMALRDHTASSFSYSNWAEIDHGRYAEIVGGGTGTASNQRKNIRTLDWNGNEYLKGAVYVGCNADGTGGTKLVTYATDAETRALFND